MDKHTQYAKLLQALRKAGKHGLTTAELASQVGSNCIWKRAAELGMWHQIGKRHYYIDRSSRFVNSRHVTVYRLVEV